MALDINLWCATEWFMRAQTVWLFATYLGWPLSITHCQVAAVSTLGAPNVQAADF